MERFNPILSPMAIVGKTTISLVTTIVIILSLLSGIVGGIWLSILGDWVSIGSGFLMGFLMPCVWTITRLPATGMSFLLALFAEKGGKAFTGILGFFTSLYINALLAYWVIWVFQFFVEKADPKFVIPYHLWGYSVMMGPISYIASRKTSDSVSTTLGVFFAHLSYLIWILYFFFGEFGVPFTCLYTILAIDIIFSLFTAVLAIAIMLEEKRLETDRISF